MLSNLFDGRHSLGSYRCVLGPGAGWNRFGVRDPAFLTDSDGLPIREASGRYVVYYNGRSDALANGGLTRVGRAESDDQQSWQPAREAVFADGAYAAVGSVLKRGAADYRLYYSPDTAVGFNFATSRDGWNWTKRAGSPILTPQQYGLRRIGLPFVRRLPDGSWVMVFEGCTRHFRIYAATSRDGSTWQPANHAQPIYQARADGWDGLAQANPSLYLEPCSTSGTTYFYLLYNGCRAANAWNLGLLRATSLFDQGWQALPRPILARDHTIHWKTGRIEGARLLSAPGGSRLFFFGLPTADSYQGGVLACIN